MLTRLIIFLTRITIHKEVKSVKTSMRKYYNLKQITMRKYVVIMRRVQVRTAKTDDAVNDKVGITSEF